MKLPPEDVTPQTREGTVLRTLEIPVPIGYPLATWDYLILVVKLLKRGEIKSSALSRHRSSAQWPHGAVSAGMELYHHHRKFHWASLLRKESLTILQTEDWKEGCKVPLPPALPSSSFSHAYPSLTGQKVAFFSLTGIQLFLIQGFSTWHSWHLGPCDSLL